MEKHECRENTADQCINYLRGLPGCWIPHPALSQPPPPLSLLPPAPPPPLQSLQYQGPLRVTLGSWRSWLSSTKQHISEYWYLIIIQKAK